MKPLRNTIPRRDELIGSLTTKLIHPGDHPLFTDFADAIQHGHEFRAQRRDVTKDGRLFEVEVRGIRLPFRGRPHMLGVVRDITEEAAGYRLLEERVGGGGCQRRLAASTWSRKEPRTSR